jgi:hypothetical protein
VTVFSVGADPRLYNEDLRQLRGELRESLETADGDDSEEMTTERQLSFETPACQDTNLGAEELN